MSDRFLNFPESNPFSTRFTAPGKVPFFFERSFLQRLKAAHPAKFEEFFLQALGAREDIRSSVCIQFLVDKFETNSRRGQIVGAHGSGKTSLMYVLKDVLTKKGFEVFQWSVHDQRHFLPDVFWLELQQFLQVQPSFLPVKCLLPPPVISREEYLEQQQSFLKEVFDEPILEGETSHFEFSISNAEAVPQVSVDSVDNVLNSVVSTSFTNPQNVVSEEKSVDCCISMVETSGTETIGNLDFKEDVLAKIVLCDNSDSGNSNIGEPVKFAPFPGIAPPNDSDTGSFAHKESLSGNGSNEKVVVNTVDKAAVEETEQKKLPIPIPTAYDYAPKRRRSLFENKVVFFDGFEQLSYANRIIIRAFCRMNNLGLLITTHTPAIGIPVLFRTNPSVEILRQLLLFLAEDSDMLSLDDSELEILLRNFHYDVREILFSLYDAVENYRWAPREIRENIVRRYPR